MDAFRTGNKLMLFRGVEDRFFGPGPCQLLRMIEDLESVKETATRMGISYSKAWKIIERMEKILGVPIVERRSGGQKGGLSHLSLFGKRLLRSYEAMERDVQNFAKESFGEHFYWLQNQEGEKENESLRGG